MTCKPRAAALLALYAAAQAEPPHIHREVTVREYVARTGDSVKKLLDQELGKNTPFFRNQDHAWSNVSARSGVCDGKGQPISFDYSIRDILSETSGLSRLGQTYLLGWLDEGQRIHFPDFNQDNRIGGQKAAKAVGTLTFTGRLNERFQYAGEEFGYDPRPQRLNPRPAKRWPKYAQRR